MSEIRRAVEQDAPQLAALNAHVQELHRAHEPERFKPTDEAAVARRFAALLQQENVRAWLATTPDGALGYVLAITHERAENVFQRARRYCEIDQLAVVPSARRRGIGRRLVEHAVRDAHDRAVHDIEISVWAFNGDALALYRSLGFAPSVIRVRSERW
ncbi:MAG: GNAT family N-acetyltransferase [Polyangiales bacterium]